MMRRVEQRPLKWASLATRAPPRDRPRRRLRLANAQPGHRTAGVKDLVGMPPGEGWRTGLTVVIYKV